MTTTPFHVTIDPAQAPGGGEGTFVIHVPDESDTAATVAVEVYLPTGRPLTTARPAPVPGWHVAITQARLPRPVTTDDGTVTTAPTKITWSGGRIPHGQYQDFGIQLGPLPVTGTIVLKAVQTYSDGTAVRWIDPPPPAGGPEPDHPAPVVTLTSQPAAPAATQRHSGGDPQSPLTLVLAIAALLAAVAALAISIRGRAT